MKLLLLLCVIFTTQSYSQSASLEELEEKQQELNQKILGLQDSLSIINEKINEFPIQDITKPVNAFALKGAIFRKNPTKRGEEIQVFERKTDIQVIDLISDYYLICLDGNCGYIYKKEVRKALKSSGDFSSENNSPVVGQP